MELYMMPVILLMLLVAVKLWEKWLESLEIQDGCEHRHTDWVFSPYPCDYSPFSGVWVYYERCSDCGAPLSVDSREPTR